MQKIKCQHMQSFGQREYIYISAQKGEVFFSAPKLLHFLGNEYKYTSSLKNSKLFKSRFFSCSYKQETEHIVSCQHYSPCSDFYPGKEEAK